MGVPRVKKVPERVKEELKDVYAWTPRYDKSFTLFNRDMICGFLMSSALQDVARSIDEEWKSGGLTKIATDLLKHLESIRDQREIEKAPAHRWMWELIQNAVDCSTHDSLKIEFEYVKPERRFVFKHNGGPFSLKEVVALIQAWSTKMEDKTLEGKFAEGFLQSHVVSEEIIVKGNLGEEHSFCFELTRTGETPRDILTQLNGARKEFESSIKPERKGWHAQFEYRSLDEKALSIIDWSLAEFKRMVPLVLALSPKLSEIRVISEAGLEYWKKGEKKVKKVNEISNLLELPVIGSRNFSVAVMTVKETCIVALGTQVLSSIDRYSLVDPRETPKLFSQYPLWGTQQFGIPIVVNHHFNVHPDRSGPTFGSSQGSQENKDALKLALKHVPVFLKLLYNNGWENLELAAWVSTPQAEGGYSQDNLDFLNESLKDLVIRLSDLPLVPIEGSDNTLPASQSVIPFVENKPPEKDYEWESLWGLVRDMSPQKIVRRNSTPLWMDVLREWVKISGEEYHRFGGMTVLDVAKEVKNTGSLTVLTQRLRSDENRALNFLKRLYQEIIRSEMSLKELGILPNESGTFVQEVYVDPGVDPELLTIAGELGFSPSNKLLYPKVAQFEGFKWNEILRSLDVAGLEGQILQKIQNEVDKRSVLAPSARFLRWLIRQGNRTEIVNAFPFVFVSETKETTGKVQRPYFARRSRWDPDVRQYQYDRLFDIATLADKYDEILEDSDWKVLEDLGIVTPTFIIEETLNLKSPENRKILLSPEENVDTKSCDFQELSWKVKTLPNLHLIYRVRVRESKDNSLDFIAFLLRHLGRIDESWKQPPEELFCIKHNRPHKFTRCYWLALLTNREEGYEWVWEGAGQASRPSIQNLKNLLRGTSKPELIEALNPRESRELLKLLGLPPHELALAVATRSADEEESLGSRIFEVVQPLREQPAALDSLAKLAQKLPPLSLETLVTLADRHDLVSDLQKMAERHKLLKDNQSLGEKVERIVKALINKREKEGRWLEIDGERIGADAAVKVKEISEEGVSVTVAKYLLEIKSTRTDHVGDITPHQAKRARDNLDTYFLCIFPLSQNEDPETLGDDAVLKRIAVVPRVAHHLEPRYQEVRSVKNGRSGEEAWVENLDKVRYAIRKQVWESAPNLEQWIDQLLVSQC